MEELGRLSYTLLIFVSFPLLGKYFHFSLTAHIISLLWKPFSSLQSFPSWISACVLLLSSLCWFLSRFWFPICLLPFNFGCHFLSIYISVVYFFISVWILDFLSLHLSQSPSYGPYYLFYHVFKLLQTASFHFCTTTITTVPFLLLLFRHPQDVIVSLLPYRWHFVYFMSLIFFFFLQICILQIAGLVTYMCCSISKKTNDWNKKRKLGMC